MIKALLLLLILQTAPQGIENRPVSIAIRKSILHVALTTLGTQEKITFDTEGVDTSSLVEGSFADQPLSTVLNNLLDQARPRLGYTLVNGVFIIRPREPIVEVDSKGKRLVEVLEDVFRQAGKKYLYEADTNIPARITSTNKMSLSDALNLLCYPLTWKLEGDTYRIIPAKADVNPVIISQDTHSGEVQKISYSSDKRYIATAGSEGQIKVWSSADGKIIQTLVGTIGDYAFTKDNREIVFTTGLLVGTYNISTQAYRIVGRMDHNIESIQFSPEAAIVLVSDNSSTAAWSLSSPTKLYEFKSSRNMVMAADPTGQILAVAMKDNRKGTQTALLICSLATSKQPKNFYIEGDPVRLQFGKDGKTLWVATDDGAITPYDTITKLAGPKLVNPGQSGARRDVPFVVSPDGNLIAYADFQQRIVVKNVNSGQALQSIGSPTNAALEPTAVGLDPSGRIVMISRQAFLNPTDKLLAYSLSTGKPISRYGVGSTSVSTVRFMDNGRYLISADGNYVRVWDPSLVTGPRTIDARKVTFQPGEKEGALIMNGYRPGSTKLIQWILPEGKPIGSVTTILPKDVIDSTWSSDGTNMVLLDKSDNVRVWTVGQKTGVSLISNKDHPVRTVLCDSNASRVVLITGQKSKKLTLWNATSIAGVAVKETQPTESFDDRVAVAAKVNLVAYSADGMAHVFRMSDGNEVMQPVPGHNPALSPDGRYLAIENNKKVEVWEISRQRIARYSIGDEVNARLFGYRLTGEDEDRPVLFTSSRSGDIVHLYEENRQVSLIGHTGPVNSVAFHPNGHIIATGGADGTVRLWNTSGAQLARLVGVGEEDYAAIMPDNYYMASPLGAKSLPFTSGGKTYPYEQFDLAWNQPQRVMAAIGLAPPEQVELAKLAYQTRLKRMGINESDLNEKFQPPVEPAFVIEPVASSTADSVDLHLKLYDVESDLARLKVTVNGVPVFGAMGMSLKERASHKIDDLPINVPLGFGINGDNQFRISVVNIHGAESLIHSFKIRKEGKPTKPSLYAVCVGVSDYDVPGYPKLPLATADAKSLADYFRSLGGPVAKGKQPNPYAQAKCLLIPQKEVNPSTVATAKAFLAQAKTDDVVILFFAGHGELDKTGYYFMPAKCDPKDLPNTALSFYEIESMVDGIASRKRLIFLDTCKSGLAPALPSVVQTLITQENAEAQVKYTETLVALAPGVTMRGTKTTFGDLGIPKEFMKMTELFSNFENNTGTTVISATVASGLAQERTKLGHGVMTYAILKGLRDGAADLDHSKVITVKELRTYVSKQVDAITDHRQKATSRQENNDLNFNIR